MSHPNLDYHPHARRLRTPSRDNSEAFSAFEPPRDVDALKLETIADRLGALRTEIKRLEEIEAAYVGSVKRRLPQGETLAGRLYELAFTVTKRAILDSGIVKTLLSHRDLVTATKEVEVTTVLTKRR